MSLVDAIPVSIKELGQARAAGLRSSGGYGQALATVGQLVGQIPQQQAADRARQQDEEARNQDLEIRRQQLATAKRQEAAQAALVTAMDQSLTPDGDVDLSLLGSHLRGTPAMSEFPTLVKEFTAMRTAAANLKTQTVKNASDEADYIGSLAAGADAFKDHNTKAGTLLAGISSAVKQGILPPERANPIIAGLLGDDGNPDPDKVQSTIQQLRQTSSEQRKLDDEHQRSNAQVQADVSRAETEGTKVADEKAAKRLSNFASQLGSATSRTGYALIYRGVPDDLRGRFDAPEDFDPKTSPQRARMASMTPKEQQDVLDRQTRPVTSPTEATLAVQAANPDPTIAGPAKKALDIMKGQRATADGGPTAIPGDATVEDVAQGERNEVYLKTLSGAQAAAVKGLADGRRAFPTGSALRDPYWKGMIEAVGKYDPSFDQINYNSRAATRKDFTSGKSAQQINALNTVVGHIAQLSDAADALHNHSIQRYNQIVNGLMTELGWTGKTDFDTIAPKVAQELTRVWRGTGGSEADISRDIEALGSKNAPAQLHSSIANLGGLVESKLEALKETYRQGMGTEDIEMISPEARTALDKIETRAGRGPKTTTPAVTAKPSGMIEATDEKGVIHHAPAGTPLPSGWTLVTK